MRARSASVVEATVVGSVARGAVASRRKTQLGMVEVSNNPITSRVFGKPDDDGRDRKNQPDMNEEIAASGVSVGGRWHSRAACAPIVCHVWVCVCMLYVSLWCFFCVMTIQQ